MANTIESYTKTPMADAGKKARTLRVGYTIKEYDDGTVALYTNNFKPFVFKLSK